MAKEHDRYGVEMRWSAKDGFAFGLMGDRDGYGRLGAVPVGEVLSRT